MAPARLFLETWSVDLPGVTSRLDYLKWLGVDTIWLSAFYASPMVDLGYDVSDHCAIHPDYGSMDDFDALLGEAHGLGLRVLVDYVPCHTSDRHAWFVESKTSRASKQRDWYIWRDAGPDGRPPTNWTAEYSGSAWRMDESTGQYYLFRFQPEQPCLNWRNASVRSAMMDVLRFWMRRGVDGFRVDAVHLLIVDRLFRDNPLPPDGPASPMPAKRFWPAFTDDMPEVQPCIREMRDVVDEVPGTILCGEIHLGPSQALKYCQGDKGLHFPLNYRLATIDWRAPLVRFVVDEYEGFVPPENWPCWALGNHDQARIARRAGAAGARAAAVLLMTLRGMPVIYYGDEIGLINDDVPPEKIRDITGRTLRPHGVWRDAYRTPMQWDDSPNAGFSRTEPWLPVSPDFERCHVASQRDDPRSMLSLYRRLLGLRRMHPGLCRGDYRPLLSNGQMFAFLREYESEHWLVAISFSPDPAELEPQAWMLGGEIILSTRSGREGGSLEKVTWLRSHEAIIARLPARI